MPIGSSASTRRGENAKLGVETTTRYDRTARSTTNCPSCFIGRRADEAEFYWQRLSEGGGKCTLFDSWVISEPCTGSLSTSWSPLRPTSAGRGGCKHDLGRSVRLPFRPPSRDLAARARLRVPA